MVSTSSHLQRPRRLSQPRCCPSGRARFRRGTVKWHGTYCMGAVTAECGANDYGLWKLTAIATVANPTGPGAADVTRTVRAKVQASRAPSTEEDSGLWNWVYSGDPATDETTCNMSIDGSVKVRSPIYAAGNLCLNGQVKIIEPGGPASRTGSSSVAESSENSITSQATSIAGDERFSKSDTSSASAARSPCRIGCTGEGTEVRRSAFRPGNSPAHPQSATASRATRLTRYRAQQSTRPSLTPALQRAHPGPSFPCITASVLAPVLSAADIRQQRRAWSRRMAPSPIRN